MDGSRRTFPKKQSSGTTTGYGDNKKRQRSSKRKQAEEAMAKHVANDLKERRREKRSLASKAKMKAPSGANCIPLGQSFGSFGSTMMPQKNKKKEFHEPVHEGDEDAEKSMVDYLSSYDNEALDDDEMDGEEHEEEEADQPQAEDDDVNDEFREKIADMPLSEVMALRDKLGSKLYDKAVFGSDPVTSSSLSGQEPPKRKFFTREHAKRPREMSSKRPVSKFRNIYADQSLVKKRFDPRFDERCGDFDDYIFGQNYSFVKDIRSQEKNLLKTEMQKLKHEQPDKAARIKDIVTRIENQERSESMEQRRKDRIRELRANNMERLRQGKNPFFMKKSELKREELEERFERLQSKGKLDKYLKRKTKKGIRRGPAEGDTQRLAFDDSD